MKNVITVALLALTVAECLCPVQVNHFQPHPPHAERCEPVQTVAAWHVTGVMPSGATFSQAWPHCTGSLS